MGEGVNFKTDFKSSKALNSGSGITLIMGQKLLAKMLRKKTTNCFCYYLLACYNSLNSESINSLFDKQKVSSPFGPIGG